MSKRETNAEKAQYHIGDRMGGIGDDCSAAGDITGESLPDSQYDVGRQAEPEYLLALLPGNTAPVFNFMAVVGMAQMPPLGDAVNGVVRRNKARVLEKEIGGLNNGFRVI